MADIKTTFRELSVATTIGSLIKNNNTQLDNLLIPEEFIKHTKSVLTNANKITFSEEILNINSFNNDLIRIIKNGYILGKQIYENPHFKFNSNDKILWLGEDTQKDTPEDIIIGEYKFSLKEDSYILENMGLYKLLNYLTGANYKRGTHIFKQFASDSYSTWFNVTWNLLVKYLQVNNSWINNDGKSKIEMSNNSIILTYNDKTSILPLNCTLNEYEKNTTSTTRGKVFSKFIKNELSLNDKYKLSKRNCAVLAAENLAKELNSNLNYKSGLARFLRIHDESYYYAKVTNESCEIYKVPSNNDLGHDIIITSIIASVPNDQANILTEIKNKKTGETLIFRNECRFSHGQFNGTPEAKLYYENNSNLLSIYEKI